LYLSLEHFTPRSFFKLPGKSCMLFHIEQV
jgi:hypothetical protein